MSGTRAGGIKARDTNRRQLGDDFYARIGALGGAKSGTGGFHYLKKHDPELLSALGRKGGSSRRRRRTRDA